LSKKILAVIKREFWTRAKTKGFIIGTLLFPLLIGLIFSGFFIFNSIFKPSTKTYVIVDKSGQVYEKFISIQDDTLKNGEPKFDFSQEIIPASGEESLLNVLKERVISEQIDGYMIIPEDILQSRTILYSARNVGDYEEQASFSRTFSWVVTNMRLEEKGLPADEIRAEMKKGSIHLKSSQITEKGEVEKNGGAGFALCYILGYIMVFMIMIYGMTVMRSVIEEKSQRITETIVSSIKPFELMLGKIIGICGLGLIQLLIFGGFILLILNFAGDVFHKFGIDMPEIINFLKMIHFTPQVFGFMIFYFISGFVFFSAIFATIGAMVTTEDEGQQLQGPVMMLIWMGFFIMMAVAKNPETPQAFWTSLFPLFTPIVMFARIVVSDPILPSGAIISLFTMTGITALLIWATAKIYRVGILMYGKKSSIKEAIKWLKYK